MSIAEHVTGLQHLGLPTAALDETAAFYESLGFVRAHSTVNPGTGERVCFLTCGGLCIETYECAAPARRPGAIDHLALDVDDIESAWEEVRMAGLAPVGRCHSVPPLLGERRALFQPTGPQRRDGGVQPEAVGRAASGCDWSVRRYLTHFFVQN